MSRRIFRRDWDLNFGSISRCSLRPVNVYMTLQRLERESTFNLLLHSAYVVHLALSEVLHQVQVQGAMPSAHTCFGLLSIVLLNSPSYAQPNIVVGAAVSANRSSLGRPPAMATTSQTSSSTAGSYCLIEDYPDCYYILGANYCPAPGRGSCHSVERETGKLHVLKVRCRCFSLYTLSKILYLCV